MIETRNFQTPPDVLDCIANLSSDEVFTSPRLANKILDLLPDKVWSEPTYKWLDPGTKSGIFLREIAKRLMHGLAESMPDEDKRREHIYRNMLYGLPITELTSLIARRTLYYSTDADSEQYAVVRMGSPEGNIPFASSNHTFNGRSSCVYCSAPESLERGASLENYAYPFIHPYQLPDGFRDMKFDVIVGNPPYQISGGGGGTNASPIYHLFVQQAISMEPRYITMITPSRWFVGGRGLDAFRAQMLADRHISQIVDYPSASDCFPGVEIKGGVSYLLWSRDHEGGCLVSTSTGSHISDPVLRDLNEYDVFIRHNESIPILEKVTALGEPTVKPSPDTPFGLATNFKGDMADRPHSEAVRLYKRGGTGWVRGSTITKNSSWIPNHKVLIPEAADGGAEYPIQVIGRPIVAESNSACTQTYLVARLCDSAEEAENFAAYMRTRFFRFLVSLRKTTQHNKSTVFSFVPSVPMNLKWTDEMLYARYGITEDEIAFIESQIKEMP